MLEMDNINPCKSTLWILALRKQTMAARRAVYLFSGMQEGWIKRWGGNAGVQVCKLVWEVVAGGVLRHGVRHDCGLGAPSWSRSRALPGSDLQQLICLHGRLSLLKSHSGWCDLGKCASLCRTGMSLECRHVQQIETFYTTKQGLLGFKISVYRIFSSRHVPMLVLWKTIIVLRLEFRSQISSNIRAKLS